jgi:hypothetical protein
MTWADKVTATAPLFWYEFSVLVAFLVAVTK